MSNKMKKTDIVTNSDFLTVVVKNIADALKSFFGTDITELSQTKKPIQTLEAAIKSSNAEKINPIVSMDFRSKYKMEDHDKVYKRIIERPSIEIKRYKLTNHGQTVCFLWNKDSEKFEPHSNSCNPDLHKYKPIFVDSISTTEAYSNFKKNIAGYWFANAVVDVELEITKKKERIVELTNKQIQSLKKDIPIVSSNSVDFKNYEIIELEKSHNYESAAINYINQLPKDATFTILKMHQTANKANNIIIKKLYKDGKIRPTTIDKKVNANKCKNWTVIK
jgi:hypothetical protein